VRVVLALALALALAQVPSVQAWVAGPDRPHHADLAVAAAQRLPPEMRDLLLQHEASFRKGALDPDGIVDPDKDVHTFYHAYEPTDGGGGGLYRVELSLHEATLAMREGKPPEEIAYQMGFLTHFVTDLAVPYHTGKDLYDSPWHEDYEKAAYDQRATYSLGEARAPQRVADVQAYMRDVAARSSADAAALETSLQDAGVAWTPEAHDITQRNAALAVQAATDILYTAFVLGQSGEVAPEPEHVAAPSDAEDLGLSIVELRKRFPIDAILLAAGALLVIALGAWLVRRQRGAKRV
jgi:hypothetical protein